MGESSKKTLWQMGVQLPDGQFARVLQHFPGDEPSLSIQSSAAQAYLFIKAYDRCMEERRLIGATHEALYIPAAICAAFALELSLKTIIVSEEHSPRVRGKNSHDLFDLFEIIDSERQKIIIERTGLPRDFFLKGLQQIRTIFEELRYFYETPKHFAIDFGFLHKLVVAIEPEIDVLRKDKI